MGESYSKTSGDVPVRANTKLVYVTATMTCRYLNRQGFRPASWDLRDEGHDTIRTSTGEIIILFSSGQQSTPAVGWGIILTNRREDDSFEWTLYSLPKCGQDTSAL